MRLLIDTHIFLWAVADSSRLPAAARVMMQDATEVYVSSASIWELAIKHGLGRIDVDPALLVAAIDDSGFIELPVCAKHALLVKDLPHHHRDPFDRLLVAQAMSEPLWLLTADAVLAHYSELVKVV